MRTQITADRNQFTASPDAIDLADLMDIYDVAELLGIPPWKVKALEHSSRRPIGRQFRKYSPRYFSRADVEKLRGMLS